MKSDPVVSFGMSEKKVAGQFVWRLVVLLIKFKLQLLRERQDVCGDFQVRFSISENVFCDQDEFAVVVVLSYLTLLVLPTDPVDVSLDAAIIFDFGTKRVWIGGLRRSESEYMHY